MTDFQDIDLLPMIAVVLFGLYLLLQSEIEAQESERLGYLEREAHSDDIEDERQTTEIAQLRRRLAELEGGR